MITCSDCAPDRPTSAPHERAASSQNVRGARRFEVPHTAYSIAGSNGALDRGIRNVRVASPSGTSAMVQAVVASDVVGHLSVRIMRGLVDLVGRPEITQPGEWSR